MPNHSMPLDPLVADMFIMTDVAGVGIFIPKQEGVDTELLALCAEYAVPAIV